MRTVAVVGNPKPQSRTLSAAEQLTTMLTGRPPDRTIDLAEVGPELLDWSSDLVADLKRSVLQADLLVVASPTYKGSYTGLLKLFLDRFGKDELQGTVAVALMVGGSPSHAMAPELLLKPVLVEIGATCATRGLYLVDGNLDDPAPVEEWVRAFRSMIASSVPTLEALGSPVAGGRGTHA